MYMLQMLYKAMQDPSMHEDISKSLLHESILAARERGLE